MQQPSQQVQEVLPSDCWTVLTCAFCSISGCPGYVYTLSGKESRVTDWSEVGTPCLNPSTQVMLRLINPLRIKAPWLFCLRRPGYFGWGKRGAWALCSACCSAFLLPVDALLGAWRAGVCALLLVACPDLPAPLNKVLCCTETHTPAHCPRCTKLQKLSR